MAAGVALMASITRVAQTPALATAEFGHLFQPDSCSTSYYSCLWSDVMMADTLAAFGEAGGDWDKATADRFAALLLATGKQADRAAAYRGFCGRDPDVNALLNKRGFPIASAARGAGAK